MAKLKKDILPKRKYKKSTDKKYGNPNWGKKKEHPINNPTTNPTTNPIKPEPIMPPKEETKPEPTSVATAPTATQPAETPAITAPDTGNGQSASSSDIPKDIFSDVMPTKEVLPLEGEMKDNAYAGIPNPAAPGAGQPDGSATAGKEPFVPRQEPGQTAPAGGGEPTISKELSASEIDNRANLTVDLILKAYEKIHGIGRWAGKISEDTLIELEALGKVDLKRVFNLRAGGVTAGQFFQEMNNAVDTNIVVSPEFRTTVTPVLKRIVIKYKLFISDEIALILIVAEDISVKISLLISYKSSVNLVLKSLQEEQKRLQGKTTPEPKKEAQASTAPPEHPAGENVTGSSEWREPE